MNTKTAFIILTGRPNVGKSTLLNALLEEKIAIVSSKPQTTRNRITGILTKGENQYVFVDTPGLHKPKNLLGEFMMKSVGIATQDADVFLFVVEAGKPLRDTEHEALKNYFATGAKVILIINKIDRVDKALLAKQIMQVSALYDFHAIIPVSALKSDGTDLVFKEIDPLLIESPHFFPDNITTSQPEKQIVAEVIREKVLRLTGEEVPHGVAVVIEEFKEQKNLLSIRAEIFCEKAGHKQIIIGKNGDVIKKIGTYARTDLEELLGIKIYLDLWIKVKEKWRDRPMLLSNFGYRDDEA